MDRDGLLTFIGREDEIFKCRGEKVAPMAVERVLASTDGVVDAAVAGVPHEEDGMAIHAVVVLEAGASVDERAIRARCREFLEPALQPRFIEFRREIPRTANGKLIRRALVGAGA
jgi:acyl-coenzyme A synthetase/AMP-(fatty) acid ligase